MKGNNFHIITFFAFIIVFSQTVLAESIAKPNANATPIVDDYFNLIPTLVLSNSETFDGCNEINLSFISEENCNDIPTSDDDVSLLFDGNCQDYSDSDYDEMVNLINKPGIDLPLKNNISASGVEKFIKTTATGDGSGSDWDNALGASDLVTTVEAGGTVYIAAGTYSPGSLMDITSNTCVIGGFPAASTGTDLCGYDPTTNITILDGNNSHRFFDNEVYVDIIEIKGLVLQRGNGNTGGVAVFKSVFTISSMLNWRFTDLVVKTSRTANNGAFYIANKIGWGQRIIFSNCLFDDNIGQSGGAISLSHVRDSNDEIGGGFSGNLVVEDCIFNNNEGTGAGGGAIFLENSNQWTIRRNTFCLNSAFPQNGGALRFNTCFKNNISDCQFDSNSAGTDGGAIYLDASRTTITNSDFISNSAGFLDRGGAIRAITGSGMQIADSKFYTNSAGIGGAIYSSTQWSGMAAFPNEIDNTIFSLNSANDNDDQLTGGGGALKLTSTDWLITNSFFDGNSVHADAFGGAINNHNAQIELYNNLFYSNTKGANAGVSGSDIMIFDNTGSFLAMEDNDLQLANEAAYIIQSGVTSPGTYDFSGVNTFSNTDDGSIPPVPIITCNTSVAFIGAGFGCPEICGNGLDDDLDGYVDNLDSDCVDVSSPCGGPYRFVKTVATGNGSGTDWDNALGASDLKTTIESGGTVYIAAGTYVQSTEILFNNNTTCIYGGYPASSTGTELCGYDPISNATVIDGNNATNLFNTGVVMSRLEMKGLELTRALNSVNNGSAIKLWRNTTTQAEIYLTDLNINNCTTTGAGAVYIYGKQNLNTKILISNCVFQNNSATTLGGALYIRRCYNDQNSNVNNGYLIIEDCEFDGNSAAGSGALYLNQCHNWTYRRNNFCSNSATAGDAGAMEFRDGSFCIMHQCNFYNNSAFDDAGALRISLESNFTFQYCNFVSNTAAGGGAIAGDFESGFTMYSSNFYNNTAEAGGAIFWPDDYSAGISCNVNFCNFVNNEATGVGFGTRDGGGAILAERSTWNISNSKFVDNKVSATSFGGAINNHRADVGLTNVLFYNNRKGTDNNILGSDISYYETNFTKTYDLIVDSKVQLGNASVYEPQTGAPGTNDFNFTTGNTFSNSDNGSLPAAPTIACAPEITVNPPNDLECTTSNNCGCPSGATTYSSISSPHTVPAGEVHCLTRTTNLSGVGTHLFLDGSLYIVDSANLVIDGVISSGDNGKLIVCPNSGFSHKVTTNVQTINYYNFGWMQLCGTSNNQDSIFVGDNSLTSLDGNAVVINEFIYQGTSDTAYIHIEPTTLNGVGTGDVCIPGGTAEMLVEVTGSIVPTCVTNCNGCEKLSTITNVCLDGSVEAAYFNLTAPPSLEICNNGIDDNGDGRIDEPYPGGVQSNLQLWLNAEIGTNTFAQDIDVTSWSDQSINGYSANSDGLSSDDPTYETNATNYNPGVVFDGTVSSDYSDGLHLGSDHIYSNNSGLYVFAVAKPEVDGEKFNYIFDFGADQNAGYGVSYSDTHIESYATGSRADRTHSQGAVSALVTVGIEFGVNRTQYINGVSNNVGVASMSALNSSNINVASSYLSGSSNGPVSIGRSSITDNFTADGGKIFNGSISEVLVYDEFLTAPEVTKIESYLAIKYGLTLPKSYTSSSGLMLKDISDGYSNDIFGIGRDDCSGLNQKQSKSVNDEAIVTVSLGPLAATNQSNASTILQDGDFVIIGHNNQAANAWNQWGTGGNHRIERLWFGDNESFTQNLTFTVDMDDPDLDIPSLPANSDGKYYLFFGYNPTFSGIVLEAPLTNVGGSLYEVTESPTLPPFGEATNFYFTIGYKAIELCGNGIDDDGDGNVDCADSDCFGTDTDGDAICDQYDLDSDNDGIPNVEEGYCDVFEFSFETDTEGWVQDNTNNGTIDGPTTHSFSTLTSQGCNMSNIPANPDGNFIVADDEAMNFMYFESPDNMNLDLSSKLNGEFSFNWINGTYDGMGTQASHANSMNINLIGGGLTISTTYDVTSLHNTDIWTLFVFDLDDFNWSGTASDLSTVLSDLDQIEIQVESISSSNFPTSTCADAEYYGLGNVKFSCDSRDNDGDLIPDYLDLDSDNDGIYDLVEAGHSAVDANTDGIIDGIPSAFGINGLFDGLETVADNGTLSYSIADSESTPDGTYDAYERDADADTCFDTVEQGIPDSDSDGIAGTGVPVVNANGLVNGITYTTPANSDWQDPNIASCAPPCNAQAPNISKN